MILKPPGTFVPFLSARADEAHHKLYRGYQDRRVRASRGLAGNTDGWDGNTIEATFADETRSRNAVLLHELYWASFRFDAAADAAVVMGARTQRAHGERRLASPGRRLLDEHLTLLREAAFVASGWALLVATPDGDVDVAMLRAHDVGMPVGTPILAFDVYEHAYWMDFGADKGAYIDKMMLHVDEDALEARFVANGGTL